MFSLQIVNCSLFQFHVYKIYYSICALKLTFGTFFMLLVPSLEYLLQEFNFSSVDDVCAF